MPIDKSINSYIKTSEAKFLHSTLVNQPDISISQVSLSNNGSSVLFNITCIDQSVTE